MVVDSLVMAHKVEEAEEVVADLTKVVGSIRQATLSLNVNFVQVWPHIFALLSHI